MITLNKFTHRARRNSLIDPNTIGFIMEKLIDMPLSEMYAYRANHLDFVTTGSYADEFLLDAAHLKHRGPAAELTLKDLLIAVYKLRRDAADGKDSRGDYADCMELLALWSRWFVPERYERRK